MNDTYKSILVKVEGNSWEKATLVNATHRLQETEWETDEGTPVFGLYDLDGTLVGHRHLHEDDYIEIWSEDD